MGRAHLVAKAEKQLTQRADESADRLAVRLRRQRGERPTEQWRPHAARGLRRQIVGQIVGDRAANLREGDVGRVARCAVTQRAERRIENRRGGALDSGEVGGAFGRSDGVREEGERHEAHAAEGRGRRGRQHAAGEEGDDASIEEGDTEPRRRQHEQPQQVERRKELSGRQGGEERVGGVGESVAGREMSARA